MNKQRHRLTSMLAATLTVPLAAIAADRAAAASAARAVAIEFIGMPAPQTDDEMIRNYTAARAKVTFSDGKVREYPLAYHTLYKNTDKIATYKGKRYAAAQLFDVGMNPIIEPKGDAALSEAADANTLIQTGGRLFLVTHWEYDDVLADGQVASKAPDWQSRMPMTMNLSELDQDKKTGKLKVKSQRPIDFSMVNGGWIFCNASHTPWNTHLAGEEDYDLQFVPGEKAFKKTQAGLKAMSEAYFRGKREANPYHYGYATEVAVKEDGSYEVTKHYEMGRGTWELAQFANDGKTAFLGDDGTYAGFFMFVAHQPALPKAGGTLYAAKWLQTAEDGADGGKADIRWVRLGSSHYNEIKALVDKGITINDIFEISLTEKPGFVPTRAGSAETVWLKLKPGMETAAAFLETRRYAAYLGATTEFTKGEGLAINHADKKLYYAISYIQSSMRGKDGGPRDDIRLKENLAGATYTFDLADGQKDTDGEPIASDFVPVRAYVEPALLGRPIPVDAKGNTADPEFIANPDNLFYSEKMRTLFIGEDSGTHMNNFVWAYHVDTQKLARLMSVAAGAEATGLKVYEDIGGHAYIFGNNQHQGGDWVKSAPAELKARLEKRAGEVFGKNRHGVSNWRLEAHVGYIGGLPAF